MGRPCEDDPPEFIEILTGSICRPANEVFTPAELEARLRWHSLRIAREGFEMDDGELANDDWGTSHHTPLHMKNPEIKLLSCASCGCDLLAPSEEHRRTRNSNLPPGVAMWAGKQPAAPGGRPYCLVCLDSPTCPVILVR